VWEAQRKLTRRLEEDIDQDESFVRRFSKRNAIRFQQEADAPPFHLHSGKMTSDLVRFLEGNELAWQAKGERHERGFLRVHPLLGELIMSTLAIACAKDEGFNIVAENGRVHRHLANHDELGAYREFTRDRSIAKDSQLVPTGDQFFEIIVFQKCDVSKLTPETIGRLSADREAIEDFKSALEKLASLIPAMRDEKRFEERIQSGVQDALAKWKSDRANMSSFARKVFGVDSAKPAGDILKSAVEKGGASLAGTAATAAFAGPKLLAWAGGAVVGLAVHTVALWASAKDRESRSPYRYLTQLEKAGVVFSVST
jgi:hypothetical protein